MKAFFLLYFYTTDTYVIIIADSYIYTKTGKARMLFRIHLVLGLTVTRG